FLSEQEDLPSIRSTCFQQQTHGLLSASLAHYLLGVSLESKKISTPNSINEDYNLPFIEDIISSLISMQPQSRLLIIDFTSDSEDNEVSSAYIFGLSVFILMIFACS